MEKHNLIIESHYLQGARMMLLKLLDTYNITPKVKSGKDDKIYIKAELNAILENKDNTRKFLEGHSGGYYDHKRDKKGNLVSCKFMFTANENDNLKLKELQNGKR